MTVKMLHCLTSGVGGVSGVQVCQWSLQRSLHSADPACWQTQGGQHRAVHPTQKLHRMLDQPITDLQEMNNKKTTPWQYNVVRKKSRFNSTYKRSHIGANGVPCIYSIKTFGSQDSPRSTSDAAHLWPPQYGLYRYYPPQRWVPGCFGNNASTMVESAH